MPEEVTCKGRKVWASSGTLVLGTTRLLASQFLTGDQNIIQMRVVVQYSVSVPADYLFRTVDVAQTAGALVEAELARRIARSEVDAVLTTEKLAIQDAVLAAQKRLDDYRAGVRLSTVNIETVTAPPEAVDAFRNVASARADTARIVSEAQAPEVSASRLYIEALEQILPKIRKLIVDPNGSLDLSIIRRGDPRNP
jgi:membrane protease subunit HflK